MSLSSLWINSTHQSVMFFPILIQLIGTSTKWKNLSLLPIFSKYESFIDLPNRTIPTNESDSRSSGFTSKFTVNLV